jgi:proteic killer suppression protein
MSRRKTFTSLPSLQDMVSPPLWLPIRGFSRLSGYQKDIARRRPTIRVAAALLKTVDVQRNALYDGDVIQGFRSKETEELFQYQHSRRFRSFERIALRKLLQLHAATELRVLASPPGNQLEALLRDRKGQHSIRINEQWRICFVWRDGHAYDVEIVDYH